MKTFDIAVNYLKEIDFSFVPVRVKRVNKENFYSCFKGTIPAIQQKYLADKNHNNSCNEYYKSICFEAALCHLIFKAHKWVSFFDVACEIVEAHRNIKPEQGSVYPLIMMQHWKKYCEDLKTKTELIESEIRDELFMVAYHYTFETESN